MWSTPGGSSWSGTAHTRLSRELGRPVLSVDGVVVGRVVDVTAKVHVSPPVLHRVAIGSRRRVDFLVPWSFVQDVDDRGVRLNVGIDALATLRVPDQPELEYSELLLGRDVLDTQVVDLSGMRLSRVSEVILMRGSSGEVEVIMVDVGMGALLQRMGLGLLAGRLDTVAVGWEDLHLASSRGHAVQLTTSVARVHRLDAPELAEVLARIRPDQAADVIRTIGPERSAAALHLSQLGLRHRLLRALGAADASPVIESMPVPWSRHALIRATVEQPRRRYLRTKGWQARRAERPGAPEGHGKA